jgi:hypothetical protein
MLYWIVDNDLVVQVLLGVMAIGLGMAWWQTRKKFWLIGTGVAVVLMLVVLWLALTVVTDRMQIERNIDGMRTAINAGNAEEAAKFFADEITVETNSGLIKLSNKRLQTLAKGNMQKYGVKQVETFRVKFEELDRPNAVVNFVVRADDDPAKTGRCRMEFTLTPQGKWRVKAFTVVYLLGDQKTPALFPIGDASELKSVGS